MKRKGKSLRRFLYRNLPFEHYLWLLSQGYFLSFRSGLLKDNPLYKYPYFVPKLVGPGDYVLDIGANLGYFTTLFARRVGKKGKVFAVEPVAPVLKVLGWNTRGYKNIEILPYALGNENKKIRLGNNTRLRTGYVASGSHFVLDEKIPSNEHADQEFEADQRRGSELFADLPRIDFIKCDVEGYETVIFPEIESLIRRHKPLILLETKREKRKQLLPFFEELGFEAYILDQGKLHPLAQFPDSQEDILFVHPEKREGIPIFNLGV